MGEDEAMLPGPDAPDIDGAKEAVKPLNAA
jgi:hypothetical protein